MKEKTHPKQETLVENDERRSLDLSFSSLSEKERMKERQRERERQRDREIRGKLDSQTDREI